MLILTDSNGIPLACSDPVAGNHNDAFELVETFEQMVSDIKLSDIRTDGLFLNADAGFDTTDFRQCCDRNEIIDNIDQNKKEISLQSRTFFMWRADSRHSWELFPRYRSGPGNCFHTSTEPSRRYPG